MHKSQNYTSNLTENITALCITFIVTQLLAHLVQLPSHVQIPRLHLTISEELMMIPRQPLSLHSRSAVIQSPSMQHILSIDAGIIQVILHCFISNLDLNYVYSSNSAFKMTKYCIVVVMAPFFARFCTLSKF